jgi:la-related protein 1
MAGTTPTWTPDADLVAADMNFYAAHQAHIGLEPSPGPPGKGNKKNQRKSAKKPSKPQAKSDRSTPSSQIMSGKKSPTLKKTKKKPSKTNPQGSSPTPTVEIRNATPDDGGDSRRADADESPAAKAAFKEFSKKLRVEERSSFQDAQRYAVKALSEGDIPESIHWKVYLELADLAKRANRFSEARNLYKKVCQLQPNAIQGWLEFSKLEEECGNMKVCAAILRAGIEYCEYNDALYARAIKHEERMGDISRARELLSRLKHLGIENVWRTVLEGALLEARSGNDVMARRVLKYLMHHVPWYGPLYLEAYKLEKNRGRSREALQVVERGLIAIPRYGPLWFGAFKLCEELDQSSQNYTLPQTMSMIDRSTLCVSKEIIWKVHLEAAHMLERCAVEFLQPTTDPTAKVVLDMSRKRFARTILTCPPNLRWKVWLASGRMEVAAGNTDRARILFLRAHQVVPDKGRAVALLECARLEEYVGDTELAKAILCKSRSVSGSDWKVWLESVLLEIRCGNKDRAIELACTALKHHSGTGRLWASLIQLYHYEEGEAKQFETLRLALNAVPKSGEVWCEAARVHLNPFSRTFDPPSARRHLSFATTFTPQYGDGFLETLRLEIIDQWLVPIAKLVWEMTRNQFDLREEANQKESLVNFVGKISGALFAVCQDEYVETTSDLAITTGLANMIRNRLKPGFRDSTVDLLALCQRCANADPNYGMLWFHCRETPSGTARQILARATELMLNEIGSYAHVYLSALVRRLAILTQLDRHLERKTKSIGDDKAPRTVQHATPSEESVIEAFLSAPSLHEILAAVEEEHEAKTGMVLLESTMTGSKFVSGLVALCNQVSLSKMASEAEKRKALFGTDALFL